MSVDEQLQREAAGRRLAVAGAVLGGVLTLAGAAWAALGLRHQPKSGKHFDADRLLYLHHHAAVVIGSAVVLGAGAVAIIFALRYLYGATKHRRPELPPVALYCAIAGPVLIFVSQLLSQVLVLNKAASFAAHHGATADDAARNVLKSGGLQAVFGAGLAGQLALGFAFVMISLNAMRVGLLTRFMGVLGIIVGVLFVIPIGSPVPVVQAFWLGALAYLLSGRWPNGVPPAWETGKAEPWPSAQEMRERASGQASAEPEPEPVAATGPSRQRKRKRKKRR
ncbi:MAG: hypothetical protein M3155_00705 [Actinomycetota bacterium]|nr:hypothetical protein [Actinomycetota bacterium]